MKISPQTGYYLPMTPRPAETGEPGRRDGREQAQAQNAALPRKAEPVRTAPSGPYQASLRAVITGDDENEIIPAGYYERGMIINTWA